MKLIVCTDGSDYGDKAVKFAAEFAQNYKMDLTLLNVIEDIVPREKLPTHEGFKPKIENAEAILSHALKLAEEVSKDTKYGKRIACGPISSEIVRIAEIEDYAGIFLGTRGLTGLKRLLIGSVADDVIRHAHCPVVVVR